jgi:hypothetical protein
MSDAADDQRLTIAFQSIEGIDEGLLVSATR